MTTYNYYIFVFAGVRSMFWLYISAVALPNNTDKTLLSTQHVHLPHAAAILIKCHISYMRNSVGCQVNMCVCFRQTDERCDTFCNKNQFWMRLPILIKAMCNIIIKFYSFLLLLQLPTLQLSVRFNNIFCFLFAAAQIKQFCPKRFRPENDFIYSCGELSSIQYIVYIFSIIEYSENCIMYKFFN